MYIFESNSDLTFLDKITYPKMQIKEKSCTFISGESGVGKSSYLRMLNKTLLPINGEILYKGQPIKDIPTLEYRKNVVLVPQDVFLWDGTIKENFKFYYDSLGKNILREESMKSYLKICAADFSLDSKCSYLSGGEKQRVFLAIFMSLNPEVLLLDEPTAALDDANSNMLLTNIKKFGLDSGTTLVIVCHNSELLKKYADETINL